MQLKFDAAAAHQWIGGDDCLCFFYRCRLEEHHPTTPLGPVAAFDPPAILAQGVNVGDVIRNGQVEDRFGNDSPLDLDEQLFFHGLPVEVLLIDDRTRQGSNWLTWQGSFQEAALLALVYDNRQVRVERDWPLPERAGEVRVRVTRSGICATDLEIIKGYMGFSGVLGHEWVGVVEAADDPAWVGRRVVGEINAGCGACALCRRGLAIHCRERTVLGISGRDGAFAEYLNLPEKNLHLVPEAVSDEQAVFCEPLAAACAILDQVHIHPTDRIAVLGAGRLGQLCARVPALTGAEVSVVARSRSKLDRLPAGIGALTLAEAEKCALLDVVVDCTGSEAGLAAATRMVRPRGTIVLKTTVEAHHSLHLAPWVIDEVRIVGSRCGPFASALRLLERGLVDPVTLIDEQFALIDGEKALERAGQPGVLKVLIDNRERY